MEESRHSCKCTLANTDSTVQGRRLDNPEHSLMQISHDMDMDLLELWKRVICSRVAVVEDRSKLSAGLLFLPRSCLGTVASKRFPTDPHLIVLRAAQRKGASGDRGQESWRTRHIDGKSPKVLESKAHDMRSWTCRPRNWGLCLFLASVLRQFRFLFFFLARLAKYRAAASFNFLVARNISVET